MIHMEFGGTQSPTHYKEHSYLQGQSSPAPQKSRKKKFIKKVITNLP